MTNSDMTSVRDAHRFDEKALEAYLASHLDSFGALDEIRQFSGGQSNPTFLITSNTRQWVLRKQPPGKLLRGAHLVDREYQVMMALRDTAVPVPATRLLCTDHEVIGTDFYVMDFVAGDVLTDPRLEERSEVSRQGIYRQLADTLAALHDIDVQAVGLQTFGKPDGYTGRQIHVWSRQYEAAKTAPNGDMDRLMTELPARLPDEPPTCIVHGDYRLGNVLVDRDTPTITAVLDWELATLGHGWVDVAHCAMMYAIPRLSDQFPGIGDDPPAGIPDERGFLEMYADARGVDLPGDWSFYMAMAMFRMASICQGVYARSLQGNASDPTASRYGDIAKVLAQLAAARLDA